MDSIIFCNNKVIHQRIKNYIQVLHVFPGILLIGGKFPNIFGILGHEEERGVNVLPVQPVSIQDLLQSLEGKTKLQY